MKTHKQHEYDRDHFLEKPLPNTEASERLVCGGCQIDKKLVGDCISKGLMIEHFYSPFYKNVYKAITELYLNQKEISPIAIQEKLSQYGLVYETSQITNLTYGLPHFSNLDEYIIKIQTKSLIRNKIKVYSSATSKLIEQDDDDEILITESDEMVKNSLDVKSFVKTDHVSNTNDAVNAFDKKVDQWMKGNDTGIILPYPEVQKIVPVGLTPSEFSAIGARPSDGKTLMMMDESMFITRHLKRKVLVFSTEQSKDALIQKMVASLSGVPHYRINQNLFQDEKFKDQAEDVIIAKEQIRKMLNGYLFIDDVSKKASQIFKTANHFIEEKGIELIYVDYLQNVYIDLYQEKKTIRRDEELGYFARDLKTLANTENHRRGKVHVRALLQLNKNSLGNKPTEKDVSESDKIYHALDRLDCPYGKEGKKEDVLREMHLQNLKNRNGRAFYSVPIYLHGDRQRFYTETMLCDDPSARDSNDTKFNFEGM